MGEDPTLAVVIIELFEENEEKTVAVSRKEDRDESDIDAVFDAELVSLDDTDALRDKAAL